MIAAARKQPRSRPVAAVEVFALRAWARAFLASRGLLTMADAVDEIWTSPEAAEVIETSGVDFAQAILAREFASAFHA